MANLCDSIIANDINFACDDLVVRGLEPDGLIINRADIDFGATVFDASKKNVIKTLVLKTGKKAYDLYNKYQYPKTNIKAIQLPSTSPANAAMSLERLVEAYKIILENL